MVGVDAEVLRETICRIKLKAPVLQFAGVDILACYSLNQVVGIDVEYVGTIVEAAQTLAP